MDDLRQLHQNRKSDGDWWKALDVARKKIPAELLEWLEQGRLELDSELLDRNGVTRADVAALLRSGHVCENGEGGLIEGRRLPQAGTYVQILGPVPVLPTVLRCLEGRFVMPGGVAGRALGEVFWR